MSHVLIRNQWLKQVVPFCIVKNAYFILHLNIVLLLPCRTVWVRREVVHSLYQWNFPQVQIRHRCSSWLIIRVQLSVALFSGRSGKVYWQSRRCQPFHCYRGLRSDLSVASRRTSTQAGSQVCICSSEKGRVPSRSFQRCSRESKYTLWSRILASTMSAGTYQNVCYTSSARGRLHACHRSFLYSRIEGLCQPSRRPMCCFQQRRKRSAVLLIETSLDK